MLRRKKSGLRAMPSQIRDKDPNCRIPKSKKPALGLVFLNMVPGLGIEPRTRGFSIPLKGAKRPISTDSFLLVYLEKNV